MSEIRMTTLTENQLDLSARMRDLETNVLLLGAACVLTTLILLVNIYGARR